MEKPVEPEPKSPIHGIALFSLDIWLSAAAIAGVSYLLFRWSADFFSFDMFWGVESNEFGTYINVVKTAAFILLFIGLFALLIPTNSGPYTVTIHNPTGHKN